jgi:hypothetical protein
MSFCMGLPYEHVCMGAVSKVVLRQAMYERLPHEVVMRGDKANISEASRRRARGPERAYLDEGLRLARRQPEWFDPATVNEIEKKFEAGEGEGPALRVAMFAWWLDWCGASDSPPRRAPALAGGPAQW